MTTQSPTLVRCERCRAVISSAEATDMIRHGVPCGVCGGTLSLCNGQPRAGPRTPAPSPSAGCSASCARPTGARRPAALAEAGIDDPANAIYELERAGHRIEREYAEVTTAGAGCSATGCAARALR